MRKGIVVLLIESLFFLLLVIRCCGNCKCYVLDADSFNKSHEEGWNLFDDGYVGIESQGMEQIEILNSTLGGLKKGAYEVTVVYQSVSNYDVQSTDNSAGMIIFSADNSSLQGDSAIILSDGINEVHARFWIKEGKTNDVRVSVRYNGNGKLALKSIVLEEKREYRIITSLAALLLIGACNFIYLVFCKESENKDVERSRYVILGIIAITIFSSSTYFTDFLYINYGHDLAFHLSRIVSLADGLREMQIPHRIQFDMLNGYGYATPLYYGEIFLILPALLYNLYVPLQTCYQIFVILVNLCTCIICYLCFGRMTQDWKEGLLGAAIYTLSAYRLTNVLVRAAVGEYTAMMLSPLLLYGMWNLYSKQREDKICLKDYLPIVLAASGIINSHVLSCEMLFIFFVLLMLICHKKTFTLNIFAALVKSGVLTLLLNLWFLVPLLQSMGMNVNVTNPESINWIEGTAVYFNQIFGVFHTAEGMSIWNGTKNEMPLSVGFPIVMGLVLFAFLYIKKDTWKLRQDKRFDVVKTCFVLGMLALFFASNFCKWDSLRQLGKGIMRITGMVQFSWRYLSIATLFLTTMTIHALKIMDFHAAKNVKAVFVAAMIASIIVTEGHFMMEFANTQDEVSVYSEANIGKFQVASEDYLLQGTDVQGYKQTNVICGDGTEAMGFGYDGKGTYGLNCSNKNDHESYVDIPVQAYDHYHAYDEEGKEFPISIGENNRVRITIPANFEGKISLIYKVRRLWRLCEGISLCTLAFMVFVYARNHLWVPHKKERTCRND